MKESKIYLILILCISSLFAIAKGQTDNDMNKLLGVKVKNVEIVKNLEKTWTVVGEVENVKNEPIKGSVKIKFLNSHGTIVHIAYAKVNAHEPIKGGESGKFEYFADVTKFNDVVGFKVLFKKG